MISRTLIAIPIVLFLSVPRAVASYDPHSFSSVTTEARNAKVTHHVKKHRRYVARYHRVKSVARRGRSLSTASLVAPLAAKTQEIVNACGSVVISAIRHTRVAGSGRMSLHASGRAVDIKGNPSCIYRHLAGWPGGYSIDYGRVKHVHISFGGREHGSRFAHYTGHRHAIRIRYAHLR